MGAGISPEGSLPGLPPLPGFPAELPGGQGPDLSFSMSPNVAAPVPPVTTGIGLSGNEQPFVSIPANPGAITAAPGPMFDPSLFTPPSNATIAGAVTAPGNPFGEGVLNPPLLSGGTIGGGNTLAGGAGGMTDFGGGGDTVTAAFDGSAAGSLSPNSSGAGQSIPTQGGVDFTDPGQGLTDSAGNFNLPPGQAPFMDPSMPTTPGQFSPVTLAGTGGLGDFFQNFLNRLGDLFTRAFLVLLGVVLLAIAVWYFGARDVKQTIARAVPG